MIHMFQSFRVSMFELDYFQHVSEPVIEGEDQNFT